MTIEPVGTRGQALGAAGPDREAAFLALVDHIATALAEEYTELMEEAALRQQRALSDPEGRLA